MPRSQRRSVLPTCKHARMDRRLKTPDFSVLSSAADKCNLDSVSQQQRSPRDKNIKGWLAMAHSSPRARTLSVNTVKAKDVCGMRRCIYQDGCLSAIAASARSGACAGLADSHDSTTHQGVEGGKLDVVPPRGLDDWRAEQLVPMNPLAQHQEPLPEHVRLIM